VNIASLVARLRNDLANGRSQTGVIVGHNKFDAVKATLRHLDEEVLARRAALTIGHFDRQNLAPVIPISDDRTVSGEKRQSN
jgi:hypothetical protein